MQYLNAPCPFINSIRVSIFVLFPILEKMEIVSLIDKIFFLSYPIIGYFHNKNLHKIIKILLNNGYPLKLSLTRKRLPR